jgi:hypothetical protein
LDVRCSLQKEDVEMPGKINRKILWLSGLLILSLVIAAGCQTWTTGTTLPSGRYMQHPPQYISPTPDSPPSPALAQQAEKAPVPPVPAGRLIQASLDELVKAEKAPVPAVPAGETPKNERAPHPHSIQVKPGQLDDLALKAEGLVVNNFCLTEAADQSAKGHAVVKLCGCYCNRGSDRQAFSVMAAGKDEVGEMLWACNVEGIAEPGSVGVLREVTLLVPAGTLKRTAFVCLRVHPVKVPRPPEPAAPAVRG